MLQLMDRYSQLKVTIVTRELLFIADEVLLGPLCLPFIRYFCRLCELELIACHLEEIVFRKFVEIDLVPVTIEPPSMFHKDYLAGSTIYISLSG